MEGICASIENMCVGELSSVLYRQYQMYVNRQMKTYGVNSSELQFLIKIGQQPINHKQLADSLCVDYAAATRSLRTLETKGLIVRGKSTADARATMVALTPQGAAIKEVGLQVRYNWKSSIMGAVTPDQADVLLAVIREMAKKAVAQAT